MFTPRFFRFALYFIFRGKNAYVAVVVVDVVVENVVVVVVGAVVVVASF